MYKYFFKNDDTDAVITENAEFSEPLAIGMVVGIAGVNYEVCGSAFRGGEKGFFVLPCPELISDSIRAKNEAGRRLLRSVGEGLGSLQVVNEDGSIKQ